MEPLAFYVRRKTHMKSSRSCMERRPRAPFFLYAAMHMLKVVEAVWSINQERLAFRTWCCACKKYKR
jgi:hypothetical protein